MALDNKGFLSFGVVIALGFIIGASAVGHYIYKSKTVDNAISVTGSAQKMITSDTARWSANFSRNVAGDALKNGSVQMKQDLDAVLAYLNQNGVKKDQITVNPVTVYPTFENGSYGSTGKINGYNFSQQISVDSSDVQNLTSIAQESTKLINQGIVFSSQPVEYYYSKLDDLKIEMLGVATDNAKQRAEAIAEKSGSKLGKLNAASMGVFQITAVNSTDVSDYGVFDTTAIQKRITAVVRTTFMVQ